MNIKKNKKAKPFIKWAGGKTQLIEEIDKMIPQKLTSCNFTYIEPFIGGGAVLFYMLNQYPHIEKAIINDINKDVINAYKVLKFNVNSLVEYLKEWEKEYHQLKERKEYYYQKRELYNLRKSDNVTQAALFIFLNKTCFNGLYRVNKKNEFNVPIGNYKKPVVCNEENFLLVHELLQKVEILNGDFENTLPWANTNTLFYFDPPYKPINKTSNFNAYSQHSFNDREQKRLANFCDTLNALGHKWILSNSDVKNIKEENNFFDDLFEKYNINRVLAKRNINSNAKKRGYIKELLISNY